MLTTRLIDTRDRRQVREFIKLPFRLYSGHPCWVPPLIIDSQAQLNRDKHPFFEHSEADFFVVERDGEVIGRIASLENKRFNQYHETRLAQFYLFECENDPEAAEALFGRAFEWARTRNLDQMVGPKGFGVLDGYGLLVEGFEHRQAMTMMNFNPPYYVDLVESVGFHKEVEFISCYLNAENFRLPERVHRIARRVLQRGSLGIRSFENKKELKSWGPRIGQAYNDAFVDNWEYYPLTPAEISFLIENLTLVANPRLIKVITYQDRVVGFLFAFPDVSAALQRARGRLLPFGLLDLLVEMRRTPWVALNGAGILPEFQGRGGNALLYTEMENTMRDFNFQHADLTQIAETAVQMRRDLVNLGGEPYKNHRVYTIEL